MLEKFAKDYDINNTNKKDKGGAYIELKKY